MPIYHGNCKTHLAQPSGAEAKQQPVRTEDGKQACNRAFCYIAFIFQQLVI